MIQKISSRDIGIDMNTGNGNCDDENDDDSDDENYCPVCNCESFLLLCDKVELLEKTMENKFADLPKETVKTLWVSIVGFAVVAVFLTILYNIFKVIF